MLEDGYIELIRALNKKVKGKYHYKKVYLYTMEGELLKTFDTTDECARYFEKDVRYIYHNLKYCSKIWRKGKWYRISREELK